MGDKLENAETKDKEKIQKPAATVFKKHSDLEIENRTPVKRRGREMPIWAQEVLGKALPGVAAEQGLHGSGFISMSPTPTPTYWSSNIPQ